MQKNTKITTGPNDRPRDETIAGTGEGLPDDSSRPPELDQAQIERMRRSLVEERQPGQEDTRSNPDQVSENTAGAGENICRRCAGTGSANGAPCPDCGGSGKVMTPIGGG